MSAEMKVGELMINIFDYPHVPYWFSIGQAVQLMRLAFAGRERPEPVVILVFDEKYNLVGTLGRDSLLRGLGPEPVMPEAQGSAQNDGEPGAGLSWCRQFGAEAKAKAERPVSEAMCPVRHFIGPDETVAAAAYMMLRHHLQLLPVLEGKKKLVGIIRLSEVFDALAAVVAGN